MPRVVFNPTVNRGLSSPLYDRSREAILWMLSSRGLRRGDVLPSEHQLCTDFKVSRTVVRQALAQLDNEGLVRRIKGKGKYVGTPRRGSVSCTP